MTSTVGQRPPGQGAARTGERGGIAQAPAASAAASVASADAPRARRATAEAGAADRAEPAAPGPVRDRFEREVKNRTARALIADAARTDGPRRAHPATISARRLANNPRVRGPESPAQVGDVVRAPKVDVTPAEVLSSFRALERDAATNPDVFRALRRAPYPRDRDGQLRWAVAHATARPRERLDDPVWLSATDDASAVLVTYARGVLAARAAGVAMGAELEAEVTEAEARVFAAVKKSPGRLEELSEAEFPSTRAARLEWAVGVLLGTWDPRLHPAVKVSSEAAATIDLVAGVLAKRNNDATAVEVRAARHVLKVDGDARVYALHTPPGPRPPEGWPTVVFFHGSNGGYAPEQSPEYQRLNALADQQGFQIVYPVGTPQDRADLLRTGRGMLNWDPVGAGPGEKNDRFVHTLLQQLRADGALDPTRTYAMGHSQGGFYVSNLIAAYPDVFAGAAILGAGAGTIASRTNFGALPRKTPLLLRVGEVDIHRPLALGFGHKLDQAGYGAALRLEVSPQQGHEVRSEDLQASLAYFKSQLPLEHGKAGLLDGTVGDLAGQSEVFLPSIDLASPPDAIDAKSLATMKMLAQTPMLDLDGDADHLTANEWRLALYYLELFPAELRAEITALRPWFVALPPPADTVLDIGALPQSLSNSAAASAAIAYLVRTPALDLDGYPTLISQRELRAALEARAQLPYDVRRGLLEVAAHVGISVDPQ